MKNYCNNLRFSTTETKSLLANYYSLMPSNKFRITLNSFLFTDVINSLREAGHDVSI